MSDNYQSVIVQKCPQCFRKDECMLLPSQRATLCLGPFEDEEDRLRKIREDNAKEKEPEADLRAYRKQKMIDEYWMNRGLFESKSEGGKRNPDDTEE